jgi:hypothetical protein
MQAHNAPVWDSGAGAHESPLVATGLIVVTTLTALLVPFERLVAGLITCLAMMTAAFFG